MAREKGGNTGASASATNTNSNTKQVLTLAGIGLALVLLSAAGTWFALQWWMGDAWPFAATESQGTADARQRPLYYPLPEPILVSFNVRGQQRYLQAGLTLMTRDPLMASAFAQHNALLQSSLMMLFSGQDYSELQTLEGKELLRQLALSEVQRLMEQETGSPGVEQILFTSFVMQ